MKENFGFGFCSFFFPFFEEWLINAKIWQNAENLSKIENFGLTREKKSIKIEENLFLEVSDKKIILDKKANGLINLKVWRLRPNEDKRRSKWTKNSPKSLL